MKTGFTRPGPVSPDRSQRRSRHAGKPSAVAAFAEAYEKYDILAKSMYDIAEKYGL